MNNGEILLLTGEDKVARDSTADTNLDLSAPLRVELCCPALPPSEGQRAAEQ